MARIFNLQGAFTAACGKLGADIVAQSTHKTLPCLTQGSILHICSDRVNVNNIETMLRMLQTTSPSYILMASIENAIHWMAENGEERLKRNIEVFKRRTLELRNMGINVLEDDFLISEGLYDFDATRCGYQHERAWDNRYGASGYIKV